MKRKVQWLKKKKKGWGGGGAFLEASGWPAGMVWEASQPLSVFILLVSVIYVRLISSEKNCMTIPGKHKSSNNRKIFNMWVMWFHTGTLNEAERIKQSFVWVCDTQTHTMWPDRSFRPAQLPGSRQHCSRLFLSRLPSTRLASFYLIR